MGTLDDQFERVQNLLQVKVHAGLNVGVLHRVLVFIVALLLAQSVLDVLVEVPVKGLQFGVQDGLHVGVVHRTVVELVDVIASGCLQSLVVDLLHYGHQHLQLVELLALCYVNAFLVH